MLLQHPMKTNAEAITGFMLASLPATICQFNFRQPLTSSKITF